MTTRKAVTLFGAGHISGNGQARLLSPGGSGADTGSTFLPSGLQWGTMGWARMVVAAVVNGPFPVGAIITGGTSAVKAVVVQQPTAGEIIVERIGLFPPVPGFADWFHPLETITADNSPATTALVGYGGDQSQWKSDAVPSAITYDNATDATLASGLINAIYPPNAAANLFYDRDAKLCAILPVAGSAWLTGFVRIVGATSGAKALVRGTWTSTQLAVANVVGTFTNGESLNVVGGSSGVTTVTGTITTRTVGEWVPYTTRPNLAGIGSRWEVPPAGSDVRDRYGSIGIEPYIVKQAYAKWGTAAAIFKLDVNSPNTAIGNASGIGSVTYGMIPCSGTFPTTWTLGETLTAAGGWSAKLVAFDSSLKQLWVKTVVGTLASGTITGSTSGATATGTGNVRGMMKGATHYAQLLVDIAAATTKLPGGDTLDHQLVVVDEAEGNMALPYGNVGGANTSLGFNTDDVIAGWNQFKTDLRADLHSTALVFSAFVHRRDHHGTTKPGINDLIRFAYRQIAIADIGFRFFTSDEFDVAPALSGQIVSPAEVVYLETMAYPKLGIKAWDSYLVSSLTPSTNDLLEGAVVLITGQSQAVGRIPYTWWLLEQDPEYGKIEAMGVRNQDTRDADIRMFNCITGAWEVYSVLSNATTFGNQVIGTSSMEAAWLRHLKKRFGRIYCIKVPFNASAMQASSTWASATWAPIARPVVTATCTVTIPAAGQGKFTATSGAPFGAGSGFSTTRVCEIAGAATGYIGGGGNNTIPAPTAVPVTITAIDPAGTWVTFTSGAGAFVADATPRLTTFTEGPLDMRVQAGQVIRDALTRLVTQEAKVPRAVATATWQGESDTPDATGYKAALQSHIEWCRQVFGHRTGREEACPHVLLKLTNKTPLDPSEGQIGTRTVRQAQAELADELQNVVTVETSDLPMLLDDGTWPRVSVTDYGGHHTPRAVLIAGDRADIALNAFDWIPANPDPSTTAGFATSSADTGGGSTDSIVGTDTLTDSGTFIVEDGTGLDNANAYCTVEYVDALLANLGDPAEWSGSTTAQKQDAIRIATDAIDTTYGAQFGGIRNTSTQALAFPRFDLTTPDGYEVPSDSVPPAIQKVVGKAALLVRKGTTLVPSVLTGGDIRAESITADAISKSTTYVGSKPQRPQLDEIDRIMRNSGLIDAGGAWGLAST